VSKPIVYHAGGFPPPALSWEKLIPHLGPASAAVARYDGMLAAIPNPRVLLSPMTTQEAVLSSKIEGTQATMGEVLEFEADESGTPVSSARREDFREILNYRRAMDLAEEMLADLPLSLRVVRAVHAELMRGVRGDDKAPGEFRRISNWIGAPGCSIEEARFVPIDAGALSEAMSGWEAYLHGDEPDRLVQLAILHAEFEALHPFLDGNGRLGRILIPLFLWQRGIIRSPMFYMSAYLEKNRDAYYEGLLSVSSTGDWTDWCRFFLTGVQEQAEANLEKAQTILALYEELKPRVAELTRSQYAIHALDWIFQRPIFTRADFVAGAGVPESTSKRLVAQLRDAGILEEIRHGTGRRPALLAFGRLFNIAEGKEFF